MTNSNSDPDRLEDAAIAVYAAEILLRRDAYQWYAGDAALDLENNYGAAAMKRLAEACDISLTQMYDYRATAAAYPQNSGRTENLSWSHYSAVKSREDRLLWLNRAAEGQWSVRRMHDEIAKSEPAYEPVPVYQDGPDDLATMDDILQSIDGLKALMDDTEDKSEKAYVAGKVRELAGQWMTRCVWVVYSFGRRCAEVRLSVTVLEERGWSRENIDMTLQIAGANREQIEAWLRIQTIMGARGDISLTGLIDYLRRKEVPPLKLSQPPRTW